MSSCWARRSSWRVCRATRSPSAPSGVRDREAPGQGACRSLAQGDKPWRSTSRQGLPERDAPRQQLLLSCDSAMSSASTLNAKRPSTLPTHPPPTPPHSTHTPPPPANPNAHERACGAARARTHTYTHIHTLLQASTWPLMANTRSMAPVRTAGRRGTRRRQICSTAATAARPSALP